MTKIHYKHTERSQIGEQSDESRRLRTPEIVSNSFQSIMQQITLNSESFLVDIFYVKLYIFFIFFILSWSNDENDGNSVVARQHVLPKVPFSL